LVRYPSRTVVFIEAIISISRMQHSSFTYVKINKNLIIPDINKNQMKNSHDWTHEVLQRLIIVFLGLLTLGVAMQSCTTQGHASCAAYDKVEVPK